MSQENKTPRKKKYLILKLEINKGNFQATIKKNK